MLNKTGPFGALEQVVRMSYWQAKDSTRKMARWTSTPDPASSNYGPMKWFAPNISDNSTDSADRESPSDHPRNKQQDNTQDNTQGMRFFSSGSYAYEVTISKKIESRDDCGCCNDGGCARTSPSSIMCPYVSLVPSLCRDTVIDPRPMPNLSSLKTVFLIRHAESDENRRQALLKRSFHTIASLSLPDEDDLTASVELLDLEGQIDSGVSASGRRQIEQVGRKLREDDFLIKMGVNLVVHSPRRRARETSLGLLGSAAPVVDTHIFNSRDETPTKHHIDNTIDSRSNGLRVVELPALAERTPLEWLPGPLNHDAFTSRIAAFEQWLSDQNESVIAVVGHSLYFKSMLGLDFKFGNCDVWRVTFDTSVKVDRREVKRYVLRSDRLQKAAGIKKDFLQRKKQFERQIQHQRYHLEKELRFHSEKIEKGWKEKEQKLRNLFVCVSSFGDDGQSSNTSCDPIVRGSDKYVKKASKALKDESGKFHSNCMYKNELPRGWSSLINLYKCELIDEELLPIKESNGSDVRALQMALST